jgi:hypothetical protein
VTSDINQLDHVPDDFHIRLRSGDQQHVGSHVRLDGKQVSAHAAPLLQALDHVLEGLLGLGGL